jgi:hypothetical protein
MCIFSSKAEARRPMGGWVVPTHAEAMPLILEPPTKKGKRGGKAPRKSDRARAPRFASVSGRGWKSVKAMTDQALIGVGAGTSNELPLVIRQSFKDGWYSPSIGLEEIEWQIMLEQFVASGVVVRDEIIDIHSDWYSHVIWCVWSFEYFITFIVVTRSHYLWRGGSLRLIRRFRNPHLWISQKSLFSRLGADILFLKWNQKVSHSPGSETRVCG